MVQFPDSSVAVLRTNPVEALSTVTVTPLITARLESVTWPTRSAVATCPSTAGAKNTQTMNNTCVASNKFVFLYTSTSYLFPPATLSEIRLDSILEHSPQCFNADAVHTPMGCHNPRSAYP